VSGSYTTEAGEGFFSETVFNFEILSAHAGVPFLQVVCLLLLAWSVGLQRYFKFFSFWNNHITVMKVSLLKPE
jgi:hypothetical protein